MKKVAVHKIWWPVLGLAFLCSLIAGQLQRLQLAPNVAIYFHDLIVLVGCAVFAWQRRKDWGVITHLRQHPLLIALLLWIGLGWGLAALRGEMGVTPLLYVGRVVAYTLFTAGLVLQLPARFKKPQSFYVIAGLGVLALGLLQYFFLPDTRFIEQWAWDSHYYRLISTQLDPNFTGILLVITLFIAMSLLKLKRKWAALVLLTFGIAATFSRASYLALGVGTVFIFVAEWWRKRVLNWQYVIVPLLLAAFIVVLPKPGGEGVNLARTSTINARLTSTQNILSTMQPLEWWTGKGLFVTPQLQNQTRYHASLPDNFWILAVSSLGIIGCVLLAAVLLQYRHFFFSLSPTSQTVLVSVMVHTQFNNTLFQPFVWLFVVGVILGEKLQPKRHF